MAEAFKNLINPETVRTAGQHLQRVWPVFDRQRFEALALDGLEALEFKSRAVHLCMALEATLPEDFHEAASVLEASLKPVISTSIDPDKELGLLKTDDTGLAGWALWAMGEYVARRGLPHPERAFEALHAITQRFTAEFAIRPLIVAHPELAFKTLQRWTQDPSAHVRRLVSEGSRPRLPWGLRLQALVRDPSPTLPLLRALQDDPSEYVRRSVANHLNDIGKDHPDVLAQWLGDHLPDADRPRQRLLRHASRSLIKSGHAGVMGHWGLGQAFEGTVQWQVSPKAIQVGQAITLDLQLQSSSVHAQTLEIDYLVHHVKANGKTSPKAFKGCRLTLGPNETATWQKRHSFKPITTRSYHAGTHWVELQINGQVVASQTFDLLPGT